MQQLVAVRLPDGRQVYLPPQRGRERVSALQIIVDKGHMELLTLPLVRHQV